MLITFEGGEGGGKTTQIEILQEKLSAKGYEVVVLREPGGTRIGEQIREVVLRLENKEMNPVAEVFLYQAARAQLYGEVILPALEAGKIVLMDRSRDSSVIYQGMVRGFGKSMIENLNDISTHNVYPNITILLDVDVQKGLERRAKAGDFNRLDAESRDFHQKVKDAYIQIANENQHGRWTIIDANDDLEAVQEAIWQVIERELASR